MCQFSLVAIINWWTGMVIDVESDIQTIWPNVSQGLLLEASGQLHIQLSVAKVYSLEFKEREGVTMLSQLCNWWLQMPNTSYSYNPLGSYRVNVYYSFHRNSAQNLNYSVRKFIFWISLIDHVSLVFLIFINFLCFSHSSSSMLFWGLVMLIKVVH